MSLARLRVRFLERWSQAPRVQAPLLSTDEVLREEAAAINGVNGAESICRQTDGPLYHALNHLNSAALCLSGGGIRSAAFALGVVQALATHPRPRPGDPVALPEHSLLARFQYLSTVSGGGYIGSWLSAWLARSEGFEAVWCNLIRRARPDHEADELGWLRSYSNYLTPRLGVTSADTWAIVSVYLRNLLLNWLVLLPAIGAGILALKAFVVLLSGFSNFEHLLQPRLAVAGAGVLFLLIALRFTTRYRADTI
jgi:hypothetical protein